MSHEPPSSHHIKWSREKIDRLWDYYGGNAAYQNQFYSYQNARNIVREARKHLPLRKMTRILDYGCGPGHLLAELAIHRRTGQSLSGMDFSGDSIQKAQELLNSKTETCQLQHVNALPSPYADSSQDLIFAIEVVEHLTDEQLAEMLVDIRRILIPGGAVFLSTPNNENLEASMTICPDCGCVFHRWQHIRRWTSASLVEQMNRAGFKRQAVRELTFVPRWRRALSFLRPVPANTIIYIGRRSTGP